MRPLAAALLALSVFCPIGAHAIVHEVSAAHVLAHEVGTAHDHDAQDERHEHELRHADDAPRVAAAATRLTPLLRAMLFVAVSAARLADGRSPRVAAVHDPPPRPPQLLASPSCAGRAPPV